MARAAISIFLPALCRTDRRLGEREGIRLSDLEGRRAANPRASLGRHHQGIGLLAHLRGARQRHHLGGSRYRHPLRSSALRSSSATSNEALSKNFSNSPSLEDRMAMAPMSPESSRERGLPTVPPTPVKAAIQVESQLGDSVVDLPGTLPAWRRWQAGERESAGRRRRGLRVQLHHGARIYAQAESWRAATPRSTG